MLTGKVTTLKEGTSLPNATVSVSGGREAAADADGNFTLSVPPGKITLHVRSVGYVERGIRVGNEENNLTISLTLDDKNMNEVVVVGYSDKKRSELTSSVTVVGSDKLKDVTSNDVGSMLQGKVAGLQVVNSSGVPGAVAEIRLRGVSSVNASQSPLTVVDGIIGGNYDPSAIKKNLGYRFVLRKAVFPANPLITGMTYSFNLIMENVGYASPFNEYPAKIIMRNKTTGTEYTADAGTDVRKWYPGTVSIKISLPSDNTIPKGICALYLSLQDKYPSLAGRSEYAIRMANDSTWEEKTGYNNLHYSLTIK